MASGTPHRENNILSPSLPEDAAAAEAAHGRMYGPASVVTQAELDSIMRALDVTDHSEPPPDADQICETLSEIESVVTTVDVNVTDLISAVASLNEDVIELREECQTTANNSKQQLDALHEHLDALHDQLDTLREQLDVRTTMISDVYRILGRLEQKIDRAYPNA